MKILCTIVEPSWDVPCSSEATRFYKETVTYLDGEQRTFMYAYCDDHFKDMKIPEHFLITKEIYLIQEIMEECGWDD